MEPAGRPGLLRRLLAWQFGALPVLALLTVVTVVLYWRSRSCGIMSDSWGLLWIATLGIPEALFYKLSYHIIPVTHLLNVILWKIWGLWEPGYQLTNLAELGLSAWVLYFLGMRLFRRRQVALLGALLLVANSSFYEVTHWPVVGNFQILAGLFQLAGIFVALRATKSPRPAPWAALFAVLAVLAFFTYEPAISMLPMGVLAAALLTTGPPAAADWSWRAMVRRSLPVLIGGMAAFAVMLGAKIHASLTSSHDALFLPQSLYEILVRIHFLVGGCLSIFTLRANHQAIGPLFYFGFAPPPFASWDHALRLGLWLAIFGVAALWAIFRSRVPALAFLALWFGLHVTIVSIATTMVSRTSYLPALPAALLLAWAISRAADAVAGLVTRSEPSERRPRIRAAISAALALSAFWLLAVGSYTDLRAAAALYRDVTLASRHIVEVTRSRLQSGTPLDNVVLVNLLSQVSRDGVSAYSFVNAAPEMVELTTGFPRKNILVVSPSPDASRTRYGSTTRHITLAALDEHVRNPRSVVLWFDPKTLSMVELNRMTWKVSREYTAANAPLLDWNEANPASFRMAAGERLDLPLYVPDGVSWAAVQLLRAPGPLQLDIAQGDALRLAVRPRPLQTPYWAVIPFPLEREDDGTTVLSLQAGSDLSIAGLWPFAAPERYTPESAPFLSWWVYTGATLIVTEPLRLPLSLRSCRAEGCAVRIEYLAEPGRDLTVSVEGGERRELTFPAGAPVAWQTLTLAAGPNDTAVVHVEPRGAQPVFLQALEAAGTTRPVAP